MAFSLTPMLSGKMWRTLHEFPRHRALTYAILALLGILSIFLFPLHSGTGPYCTVHGPLVQFSESDWCVVVAFWLHAGLILMLFRANSHKLFPCDLQTLTCTRNC